MQRRHFLILLLLYALTTAGTTPLCLPPTLGGYTEGGADLKEEKKSPAKAPSYQDDIRPLFQAKCLRCHGGKARKRDLDLSAPAGVLKGSESGPVIVPGKPDESLLYEKIIGGEMPPGKKDPLSKAEVETIRRWIAGGAKFGFV